MLETVRVQERRVKGEKKVERESYWRQRVQERRVKEKKKRKRNREERVAGGTKAVRECKNKRIEKKNYLVLVDCWQPLAHSQ